MGNNKVLESKGISLSSKFEQALMKEQATITQFYSNK